MNRLPIEKQKQILRLVFEGMSIRGISRAVDATVKTVARLLVECGRGAQEYQEKHLISLPCKRVEVDEIWSFCHTKLKNCSPEKERKGGYGDLWTWTAIDADSRFMIHWLVGNRDLHTGKRFMDGLSSKLSNRIQLSADGFNVYSSVADGSFKGGQVDFGVLMKRYENDTLSITKMSAIGNPNPEHISTSKVERQNLTIRMENRRFARRTNAHSKKVENHALSIALYFLYYNFGRIHTSLRTTPAMALGIADHVWEFEELLSLRKGKAN
jgi:IS1 family transposase